MNHPTPPTYQVPPSDGDRIADPGRWGRCLALLAIGIGPLGITIFSAFNIALDGHIGTSIRSLVLNQSGDPSGALILPCLGLTPIILLALWHNLQAWRAPTMRTVGLANQWARRLRRAIGWAVVAGVLLTGWIFWWAWTHFSAY